MLHEGHRSGGIRIRTCMLLVFFTASVVALPAVRFVERNRAVAQEGAAAIGSPFPSKPVAEFLPEPTEAETRIASALDQPTTFDLVETPLNEAISFIRDFSGVNIVIDERGLLDGNINRDIPVTLNLQQVKLRSALRLLLRTHGLGYMVIDDVLMVTDEAKTIRTTFVTRTYPVFDLCRERPDYEELVETIKETIEPRHWRQLADATGGGLGGVGGADVTNSNIESLDHGAVGFVFAAGSIIVRATQPVHEKVLELLRTLRAARDPSRLASQTGRERKADPKADVPPKAEEPPKRKKAEASQTQRKAGSFFGTPVEQRELPTERKAKSFFDDRVGSLQPAKAQPD